ncbi:MAG TPA: RNA polymerase sigma factor [Thermomicrobiales bacterium]|nr:RNA polymerase sigma factor [Thermomicrobiales bacterium]
MVWQRFRSQHGTEATAVVPVSAVSNDGAETLDDAWLVAAALADRNAFRPLYERHLPQVYHFCYLRLGSREAAEDATSEIFIKAINGLRGYHGGAFAGWLFRIAQHAVVDIQRAQRRRPIVSLGVAIEDELMDPTPMPEDRAISQSELDIFRDALGRLPHDQRTLLELQLAGLSTQQIAEAMGRSAGAVRMLRMRAFQQLRSLLEGSGLQPGASFQYQVEPPAGGNRC